MKERNLKKELCYYTYADMENGNDIESIDYNCLIQILDDLYDKIESLERDNEFLKSYAWER
jgi:hypothetical protein